MWNFLKRLRVKILVTKFVLSAGFVADIFYLCFDFKYNFIVVFAGEHSTWLSERRSRVVLIVILFLGICISNFWNYGGGATGQLL